MLPKELKIEKKKGGWYEFLCNFFGKAFEFPLKEENAKKLSEDLEFCDLKIKPNYVYSTAIVLMIIGIVFSILLF